MGKEIVAANSKYTEEFKIKVAKATLEDGSTLKSVGEKFGVHPTLVRNWKLKFGGTNLDVGEAGTTPILILVDLYQRIEDEGVEEFDDLDADAQLALIVNAAKDFFQQVAENFTASVEVHLLGLEEKNTNFVGSDNFEMVNANTVSQFYDDGFIQFSVSQMDEIDWSDNLAEISANLDCIISAIGVHPNYEGIIKQGYAIGELEDGMISDEDEDEFWDNDIWNKQYDSYFNN